jgi:hypothetical protein
VMRESLNTVRLATESKSNDSIKMLYALA